MKSIIDMLVLMMSGIGLGAFYKIWKGLVVIMYDEGGGELGLD
jgi:uncharacterized protein HemY